MQRGLRTGAEDGRILQHSLIAWALKSSVDQSPGSDSDEDYE